MREDVRKIWKNYYESVSKAMNTPYFQVGVERATTGYEEDIRKLVSKYPEFEKLTEEVREIKRESIERIDELLKIAIERFRERGFHVHYAHDSDEARSIIGKIIGKGKVIVKAKSIATEEIGLREYLIELGSEVWETDLGEFIIQLLNDRPMHVVTPSLHVPKEKVAEIFQKFFKREFDPSDIPAMVKAASDFLRKKYYEAEFGVTGANVVAAYDGAVVLIHNEGNIRFTANIPPKLIVLAGIEKIVPTLMDAIKVALVVSRYAKYKVAGYYDIIGGVRVIDDNSRWPEEAHIVFLDNGRSKLIRDPKLREAAMCIRCGACMYSCPVFKIIAGIFGGRANMGGIGAIWTYAIEGLEKAVPLLYTCLLDGRCVERCPMKINTPEIIRELRRIVAKK